MTKEQFDSVKITSMRRAGNTTRIIDALVQQLFTHGNCEYWDHADRPDNSALRHCLGVLERRLHIEHCLKRNVDYTINLKEHTIKLKQDG